MKLKFLIGLFLVTMACQGQMAGMINYGQEQGLTADNCYIISQDQDGFIWIGSDNGAFRFDGTEFKQFSDPGKLSNLEILKCQPLNNGSVFLLPAVEGISYIKDGKIYNRKNNPELNKLDFSNSMYECQHDAKNDVLYLYAKANPKNIYLFKNGKIKTYSIDLQLNNRAHVEDLICIGFNLNKKTLYYKDNFKDHFFSYEIKSKKTRFFDQPGIHNTASFKNINRYILCTQITANKSYKNFIFWDAPTTSQLMDQVEVDNYYYSLVDDQNCFWAAQTSGGMNYYGKVGHLRQKPLHFLRDYIINHVFRDREGNVWFSTKGSGIFFLSKTHFESYLNSNIKNNENVWKISVDSGGVALGLSNSELGFLHHHKIDKYKLNHVEKLECRGLFVRQKKYVFGSAAFSYWGGLKNFKPLKNQPIFRLDGCKNIVPDGHQALVCTHTGLYLVDPDKRQYSRIFNQRCYAAVRVSEQEFLVATYANLYRINVQKKQTTLCAKNCFVTDLAKANAHEYVAATSNSGLLIFNYHGLKRSIGQAQGLTSHRINKITVQNPNCYWASSSSGLIRIQQTGEKPIIRTFTRLDGLPSDQVNDCKILNDSIYIATAKGLGVYALNDFLKPQTAPRARVIIDWVSSKKAVFNHPKQNLKVQHPDNYIKIKLSYPDFISSGSIHYRYFIEGLSQKWETTNSNTLVLNKLSPGKYVLKIYGIGSQDRISLAPTVLSFEILPQFWQTWWFKGLIAFLLLILLFLISERFFHKRRQQKLTQLIYEKKAAELELQAIKAQINPHFIYNCLNSMKYLLYVKEYEQTGKYLDSFSKMIRHTLHYSEKTFISIEEEMAYLSLYLSMEELRFRGHFSYEISCTPSVKITHKIPSLLIQPFVENALKHGVASLEDRNGHVQVLFDQNPQELIITITDNGNGILEDNYPTDKSESFGIKLSQKRVETFKLLFETKINLEIINQNASGQQGTQVKIRIKKEEHEN